MYLSTPALRAVSSLRAAILLLDVAHRPAAGSLQQVVSSKDAIREDVLSAVRSLIMIACVAGHARNLEHLGDRIGIVFNRRSDLLLESSRAVPLLVSALRHITRAERENVGIEVIEQDPDIGQVADLITNAGQWAA